MNTQSWIYLDDTGGKRKINLYHSPAKGMLLVQVDGQVVVASKEANRGGKWTFLIEDQLCDVVIWRRGMEYSYGFRVNDYAESPRNRAVKIKNRRDFWLPTSIFLGALLIGAALLVWRKSLNSSKPPRPVGTSVSVGEDGQLLKLGQLGRAAVATFTKSAEVANYSFRADSSRVINGSFIMDKNAASQAILPTGFPLENGDEFVVVFLPEEPSVHRLELMQPVENQMLKYEKRAAEVERVLHPNEPKSRAECLARVARRATGLRGLADIFYQNYKPTDYPEHNRDTYNRLVRDVSFQKMLAEKCLE